MQKHRKAEIKYPFPINLPPHPNLEKAFRTSKLSIEQNKALVYGFFFGLHVDEVTQASFVDATGNDISRKTKFERKPLSEVTVRKTWRDWRRMIFSQIATPRYILERVLPLLRSDSHATENYIKTWSVVLYELGLTDDISQEEWTKRLSYWSDIKQCLTECGHGLDTKKYRRKTNGHTRYRAALSNWRTMLEANDGEESHQRRLADYWDEYSKSEEYISSEVKKKYECRHCRTRLIQLLPEGVIQSLLELISHHRLRDTEDFYLVFCSSLTTAILREEIVSGVYRLNNTKARWLIIPESVKTNFRRSLYDLDIHYQQVVNTAAFALTDCLIEGNVR